MARKKIECITCDRCDKTYEEVAAGEEAPDRTKLMLESFAGDVSFEDLCDKCTKRVTDLVGQIRRDPTGKDKDAKKEAAPKEEKKAEKAEKKEEPKKDSKSNRSTQPVDEFA
jgi:hypothetical protein